MASNQFLVAWPDVVFCIFYFTVQLPDFPNRIKETIDTVSSYSDTRFTLVLKNCYSFNLLDFVPRIGEQRSNISFHACDLTYHYLRDTYNLCLANLSCTDF